MLFRKAKSSDIDYIEKIYADIHTQEEKGITTTGWIRGIYPVRAVAEKALNRGDLFVLEDESKIVASAIINQTQCEEYRFGKWNVKSETCKVMVLHTLVVSPETAGHGYGKAFVNFYEQYSLKNGCPYLRMDTNERNIRARGLYKSLGYKEVGVVPCDFNGIKNVNMVLIEKNLKAGDNW